MKIEGTTHSVATFRFVMTLFVVGVIAFCMSQFVTYYVVAREQEDRQQGQCEVANTNRTVLRDLLELARQRSQENPDLTPEQRSSSEAFYERALSRTTPIDCSHLTE